MASEDVPQLKQSMSFELDVEKLHSLPSEQQNLYLLTFTSDLARHVASLDNDAATSQQASIKRELIKILGLSSPLPTRVIRNNLGNALAGLFVKSDRKILYETCNDLNGFINIGKADKSDKEGKSKHAAVHCLGAVFEVAGDSAVSIAAVACNNILKLWKSTQNNTGFRAALLKALGRIIKGIGRSADESIARDIYRQARSAATGDKSYLVQREACWCIEQLCRSTQYFENSTDYDRLQSAIWKALESPSLIVRRAASSCLAAVLVKSHAETANQEPLARSKKSKKARQVPQEDGEDVVRERSESPGRSKSIALCFTFQDMLKQLSGLYVRATTSNRVRAGLAACYVKICRELGESVLETHYSVLAAHLFNQLLGATTILNNRYRLLITRKFVHVILSETVGRKILGETAQLDAVNFLVNGILKDYPQSDVKERPEPSKEAIIAAFDVLTNLIEQLGSAMAPSAEACRVAILQVLEHPSYAVQVHAAHCLQALVRACPQHLLPSVMICMNSVNREIGQLSGPRRSPRRCLGFAFGLAAAISTSTSQPLYGSVDVYSRILSQAISILKSSGGSDLQVSSTQIQVAWILIGGLMSLGPSFVKIHLSQLLLLWKNALPIPLSKENTGQQGLMELSFLAHVRECALGSILAFLMFNGRLITLDVSKRLATMLDNTTNFLNSLPIKRSADNEDKVLSRGLHLSDYELMVKRRVFECYNLLVKLSPQGNQEALLQSRFLALAVSSFANPETGSTNSLSTTIATSSGNFEGIWEVGDNSGFGVSSLTNGLDVEILSARKGQINRHWLSGRDPDAILDQIIHSPTCTSIEHDAVHLYSSLSCEPSSPLATAVVDAAIKLFATALPFQPSRIQEASLEQISSLLASEATQNNPAIESAVAVNISLAILYTLQVAAKETDFAPGMIKAQNVEKAVQELLHGFLVYNDQTVRNIASEGLGRLCKIASNDFTTKEVGYLVDRIVNDREPHVRAGCAMALGCIHSELGGMAAGFHMKNILGVLCSLGSDPHPTVHFWAMEGLAKIADSAGLAFSPHVSSMLGMVAHLYVLESHNDETPSLGSSNIEVDLPAITVLARCVNAMTNVLGPDLQDQSKTRNMILTLTYQFQTEELPLLAIESLKCVESLSLYAPDHISFQPYVRQLLAKMSTDDIEAQEVAIRGLHNEIRRGADQLIETGGPALEDQLWMTLNKFYGQGIIRDLLDDWVQQSGKQQIDVWVGRIQGILNKARARDSKASANAKGSAATKEIDLNDEEVAGFAAAAQETVKDEPAPGVENKQELLRWQVRFTAMTYLNDILSSVAKEVHTYGESDAISALQHRIADIVRIAFSASTASVVELRIRGIQIIGKILQIFGRVPDPDFPDATLLEQYQAQISSALTPAFAADSSPVLAAGAISVCASFISTGIVTSVERMGRILKQLVSALEDFSKNSEAAAIGDLKGLSSNAQVMVKLSVFSAWAELQIASHEQTYLEQVIHQHLAKLTPLWLGCLREYARLKFEPEISTVAPPGTITGDLNTIYATLNRETLLEFYQNCWLNFVDAIASLIDEDSEFVFDALDGKTDSEVLQVDGTMNKHHDINYRDEPVAFFFVLFGISFEALVARVGDSASAQSTTLELLVALRKILRPAVAGIAVYQEAIFSELMELLARLALTEGLDVQTAVVEIASDLCTVHPSARRPDETPIDENNLSDDIDQLFELTRIIVLVISNHVANLSDNAIVSRLPPSEDTVNLINLALTALVDSAQVYPAIIKADLHACILHVFATILSTGACQEAVVPQALPIFRRFIGTLAQQPQLETVTQLRNTLARFHIILKNAQRRESEAAVPCEKNTLLASTILLTSAAKILPSSDPLIRRFVEAIADCLGNRLTTKVSAGLSRSLLMLPFINGNNAPNKTEISISSTILPYLIDFLASPSDVEGTEETRPMIAQSLTNFVLATNVHRKAQAMGIVVPTLLQRAQIEGEPVYKETSARLMDLASREQDSFRNVLANIGPEQRRFTEEVLRKGGVGKANTRDSRSDVEESGKEPTIALRMDFG